MDMQHSWACYIHGHVARTYRMEIPHGNAACTCARTYSMPCSMGKKHGNVALTFTFDMQQGHTTWTCSTDLKDEHAARTCKDKHHGHAVWTCRVNMQNDTQSGQEAWTLSMDMQQGHTAYLVRKSGNLSLVRYLADDRLAELIRGTSA
jgi:hypothetical protein